MPPHSHWLRTIENLMPKSSPDERWQRLSFSFGRRARCHFFKKNKQTKMIKAAGIVSDEGGFKIFTATSIEETES